MKIELDITNDVKQENSDYDGDKAYYDDYDGKEENDEIEMFKKEIVVGMTLSLEIVF